MAALQIPLRPHRMSIPRGCAAWLRVCASGLGVSSLCVSSLAHAQTPEQQQLWQKEHQQSLVEANAQAEKLAQQRAQRKADPMSWVGTLDPLTAGGWQFRAVAPDGSWAAYSTSHQLRRSGHLVTAWIRQEYPEPQRDPDGNVYVSNVEKVQYDCSKERVRALLVIYYAGNNLSGSQQTDETDEKHAPWSAIVPGTQSESVYRWACPPAGSG